VDRAHKPVGMLSMNDLARHASKPGQRHNGLSPSTIVETLAAVCEPTADLPQIVAAAF
jgi:hypothetical protein